MINKEELCNKIKFVEGINKTINEFKDKFSAEKVEYFVFECPYEDDIYGQEFLVITFKGGAISARNCNGNSLSAILEEISRLINGGYYSEVETFKYYINNYEELNIYK